MTSTARRLARSATGAAHEFKLKALWPRDLVIRHPPQAAPGSRTGPPDYVGVGAQKAGTSWWHSMVTAHPDVYSSPLPKELHFFDQAWHPARALGAEAYHALFPRPDGMITGEWTPRYLADFWVAPMLHAAAPDAKLLVLLRDPVDRFESGVTHELAHGGRIRPVVAAEAFGKGHYAAQLTHLLAHVPREQVLVQQYEACRDAPAEHLRATYAFLGLDPDVTVPATNRPVNATTGPRFRLSDDLRAELVALYAPGVAELARRFPEIDPGRWRHFRSL